MFSLVQLKGLICVCYIVNYITIVKANFKSKYIYINTPGYEPKIFIQSL